MSLEDARPSSTMSPNPGEGQRQPFLTPPFSLVCRALPPPPVPPLSLSLSLSPASVSFVCRAESPDIAIRYLENVLKGDPKYRRIKKSNRCGAYAASPGRGLHTHKGISVTSPSPSIPPPRPRLLLSFARSLPLVRMIQLAESSRAKSGCSGE